MPERRRVIGLSPALRVNRPRAECQNTVRKILYISGRTQCAFMIIPVRLTYNIRREFERIFHCIPFALRCMRFYEEAATYRLPARIINTPSSAGTGCGLSVKMLVKNLGQARVVLERMRLNSVIGFFYLTESGAARRM